MHMIPRQVCVALAMALLTAVARAAPGDLDTTYGTSGVLTPPADMNVVPTPDGRLLLWQQFGSTPTTQRLRIRRLSINGQADSSWGAGGEAVVDMSALLAALAKPQCTTISVLNVTAADDGSAVVQSGVNCGGSSYQTLFSRVRADAVPDGSFGAAGIVVLTDAQNNPVSGDTRVVALPADGSVLVADWWYDDYGNTLHSLYRISSGGTVSALAPTVDAGYFDGGRDAAARVLPSGKIIIVGGYEIRRLNADGSADASYGTAGVTTYSSNSGSLSTVATAVAAAAGLGSSNSVIVHDGIIATDGSAVLAMSVSTNAAARLLLARINASGQLDTSFGNGGVAVMDTTGAPWASLPIDYLLINRLVRSSTGELTIEGRVVSSAIAPRHVDYSFLWRRGANGQAPAAASLQNIQVLDEVPSGGCCLPSTTLLAAQSGYDLLLTNSSTIVRLAGAAGASPGLLTMAGYVWTAEGGTVQIPVWRTAGSNGPVSLNYATSSAGSSPPATAGSDYVATSGRLDWADGESGVKYISIVTVNNSTVTSPVYLRVNVSSVSGGAPLMNSSSNTGVEIRNTTPSALTIPPPTTTPTTTTSASTSNNGGGGGGGALDLWWLTLLALALVAARYPARRPASRSRHR